MLPQCIFRKTIYFLLSSLVPVGSELIDFGVVRSFFSKYVFMILQQKIYSNPLSALNGTECVKLAVGIRPVPEISI